MNVKLKVVQTPSRERRSRSRLATYVSAKVRVLGMYTPAVTENLSAAGVKLTISSPCFFEAGEHYPIEILLHGDPRPIVATGRVTRANRLLHPQGRQEVAFEFAQIDEKDQARIAEFVTRKQAQRRMMGLE